MFYKSIKITCIPQQFNTRKQCWKKGLKFGSTNMLPLTVYVDIPSLEAVDIKEGSEGVFVLVGVVINPCISQLEYF